MSIRQVAESTKLSVRVLLALEERRVDDLPPGIYRRAAVRAYAREVGLDAEATLLAYLREYPDQLPPPGRAMATLIDRGTPSPWPRLFRWLGVVVPAVAAVAYLVLAFGLPGGHLATAEAERRVAAPVDTRLAQRVSYVDASRVALTLTSTAPTRVTIVSDGDTSDDRVLEPGTALTISFRVSVEIRAASGASVLVGMPGAPGRPVGASAGPQTLRLTRETYADALRLR